MVSKQGYNILSAKSSLVHSSKNKYYCLWDLFRAVDTTWLVLHPDFDVKFAIVSPSLSYFLLTNSLSPQVDQTLSVLRQVITDPF